MKPVPIGCRAYHHWKMMGEKKICMYCKKEIL